MTPLSCSTLSWTRLVLRMLSLWVLFSYDLYPHNHQYRLHKTLVFNKGDVFAKEMEGAPLNQWMHDYSGKTYDDACKHVEGRFIELVKDKNRVLRIHYTTAVDEKTMMGTWIRSTHAAKIRSLIWRWQVNQSLFEMRSPDTTSSSSWTNMGIPFIISLDSVVGREGIKEAYHW